MSRSLRAAIRSASHKMFWNPKTRGYKRIVKKFADKVGLVYFGVVSQKSNRHKVVRGFTVSPSHKDNHYSVGTVSDCNVAFVDRSDAVWQADGSIDICNWLIMTFELHTEVDVPHFFLGAKNRNQKSYQTLFATHHNLKEVAMGTFEEYTPEFISRFAVYTQPAKSIEVERLLPANTARVLSAHFWPFSIEQNGNILYIYSAGEQITPGLLSTMLESGLWLAKTIDSRSESI